MQGYFSKWYLELNVRVYERIEACRKLSIFLTPCPCMIPIQSINIIWYKKKAAPNEWLV